MKFLLIIAITVSVPEHRGYLKDYARCHQLEYPADGSGMTAMQALFLKP